MNWKELSLYQRFYLSAAGIFVVGVLVGAVLFLAASNDPSGGDFVIIGGQAYSTGPSDSKSYDAQLERMGGRSLVLTDQFNRWFASLWQGENLGLTIALLASVLALILLWIGREVKREQERRDRS